MNVADVMTRKVISVTPETTIAEAAQLLLEHRISGLPVVDPGGAVVGIVTEGDLLRRVETGTQRRHSHWLEFLIAPGRLAREYTDANARNVGEVMSAEVVSVTPRDALPEVIRLMEHHHVKRLPVIEAGRLVGIVSRANLVRALLDNLSTPAGNEIVGDAEIRERIRPRSPGSPGDRAPASMSGSRTAPSSSTARSPTSANAPRSGSSPKTSPASKRCAITSSGSSRCRGSSFRPRDRSRRPTSEPASRAQSRVPPPAVSSPCSVSDQHR